MSVVLLCLHFSDFFHLKSIAFIKRKNLNSLMFKKISGSNEPFYNNKPSNYNNR